MSYLEIVERVLEKRRSEEPKPQADISLMRLSELAKRDMAVEIYSEILGCQIWLCSNELMASQVKKDDPDAVTYTVDEIRKLLRLKPKPDELKRIHYAKSAFLGSTIIDGRIY